MEKISPQSRTFVSPPAQTSEAALLTRWNGQLYAVLGDRNADGRWQLRLWWKPFVPFIWYGGLLIALGGLLALVGRTARDVRHRRRSAKNYISEGDTAVKSWKTWMPLGMFAVFLAIVAGALLWPAGDTIKSRMIGKKLPEFALPAAAVSRPGLASANMRTGQPQLLNIFASWCLPCRAEAPNLSRLASSGAIINGVAIRDTREDVTAFLSRYGNPYTRIAADDRSSLQFEIGSSGVPETFVIDGKGHITYQHVGDIRNRDVPILLEKLREAR